MEERIYYYEAKLIALNALKRRVESIWPDVISDVTAPGKFDIDVQVKLVEHMVDCYSDVLKDIDRVIEYAQDRIDAHNAEEHAKMGGTDEAVQDTDRNEDDPDGKED